ncbi:MAG: hypothetical protein K2J01_00090 [Clostridiales bacterium]|nr:hypothetical protein [Clostridiales bacterium]
MRFKEMNKKLREVVGRWVKEKFELYMKYDKTDCTEDGLYNGDNKDKKGMYLSCPFYMGVTEDYAQAKSRRVMVIGQEARRYGIWRDDCNKYGYKPRESQEWAIDYLLYQLKTPNKCSRFEIDYNNSRFWDVFRKLKANDFSVCWNNIDNVYYSNGNKDYKGTLTYKGEEYLSAPYGEGEDKKSLLQREIEITNPDALLFVIGPSYYVSMAVAFGLSLQKLNGRLNKNSKIVDITSDICMDIPAYWTYHPANRHVNSVEEFLMKYKG